MSEISETVKIPRLLIVDTAYWAFLKGLGHAQLPNKNETFGSLSSELGQAGFGVAHDYCQSFRSRGFIVESICPNDLRTQLAWAREHNTGRQPFAKFSFRFWPIIGRLPLIGPIALAATSVTKILANQIESMSPDVVLVADLNVLPARMVEKLAKSTGAMFVGQIASPLPSAGFTRGYHHIVSAHPGLVESLKKRGNNTSYLPLASGVDLVRTQSEPLENRKHDVAFVGSFGRHHKQTYKLLQKASMATSSLVIYGNPNQRTLRKFGLTDFYRGTAFGKEMLEVFGQTRIVLNRHARFADGYSVNMRMFEAIGSGAALLTESSPNLRDLFADDEVATYENINEVPRKLTELLTNLSRTQISADAARERLRQEHTYDQRAAELGSIFARLAGWNSSNFDNLDGA